MDATNTLIVGLKSAGIWSKLLALYLISPTSYGASVFNAVNPVLFKLTEGTAPTYSRNGFYFNGKTQYLKTGIIPSTHLNMNDNTVIIRGRSNDGGAGDLGCYMSASQNQYYEIYTPTIKFSTYSDSPLSNRLDVSGTDGTGNFFFNLRSSTNRTTRKNKVQVGTKATAVAGTVPTIEFYIGARNDNGAPNIFSLQEVSTIGIAYTALSDAECDTVSDLIDAFNSTVISGGR